MRLHALITDSVKKQYAAHVLYYSVYQIKKGLPQQPDSLNMVRTV